MKLADIAAAHGMNAEAVAFLENNVSTMLTRASTDDGFRTLMRDDAWGAFASHTGLDPAARPAEFNLRFIEGSAASTIVLPDVVTHDGPELSDAELEDVAGGATPAIPVIATWKVCVAVAGAAYACYSAYSAYKASQQ